MEFSEAEHEGVSYLRSEPVFRGKSACFRVVDERTLLAAEEGVLREMLKKKGRSNALAKRLLETDTGAGLVLEIDFTAWPEEDRRDAPVPAAIALGEFNGLSATVDLDGDPILSASLHGKTPDSAKNVATQVEAALTELKNTFPALVSPESFYHDDSRAVAIVTGIRLLEGLQSKRSDSVVEFTLKRSESLNRQLRLLGWVAAKEMVFRGMIDNARMVRDAVFAYMRKNGVLPPAGNATGLSWRVHLLPFLGEQGLFDEFHLDESWDSEHNLPLLDRMPSALTAPGTGKDNTTPIMVFTGKDTHFPPEGPLPIDQITDPAKHTILVIWAGADKAVPWTKPADLEFNPENPLPALGKTPDYGSIVMFGSGETTILPQGWFNAGKQSQLKAMVTPNGGEPVDNL